MADLVLIVDDDEAVRTTLYKVIRSNGLDAHQAASGKEALQMVQDGGEQQKNLLHRTGALLSDIVGKNLRTNSTETEIELNFAVVKIKHKVIRKEE